MSKAIEAARYVEKSKSCSHHQLEGDQGDSTRGNMLDWCGSGEETGGGNLYLSMELLKGPRWLRLGRLGMALPQREITEMGLCATQFKDDVNSSDIAGTVDLPAKAPA